MTIFIKKELFYGTRALLRDNLLCKNMTRHLRAHERMDKDGIERLSLKYLHQSLQSAISRLPYYSNVPFNFSAEESPRVLQELFPIIDKVTLLDNRSLLYPNNGVPKPWQSVGKTSGTTGSPLSIFRSPESVLLENAFLKRHWAWSGYRDGMKRATLRGELVAPLEQSKPPFWFMNRYNNQLLISSRHLKEPCINAIIGELDRFTPAIMQAYPSTAFTLAQHLSHRNQFLYIPYVFTASEPLYSHQRELIEERLRCKVMDMYGMAERVAFATECEFGEIHINPDYSYVEIVDEEGLPTEDYGYVVGTTFHNRAMPLVRYKLTDRTRWKPGNCQCGRPFPMIEPVSGKYEDSITGSDGEFVSPSVLTFAFKGVENILKSQVAQITQRSWEIRVVPGPHFSMKDQQKLISNIHELVDAKIAVQVVLKDNIPNTSSGKFRWVVNESIKV